MSIVKCNHCNTIFDKPDNQIKKTKLHFCSQICFRNYQKKIKEATQKVLCVTCNAEFYKKVSDQKKTKNNFCCKSCAAIYNNRHKTHGTRISKLELFLQENLQKTYSYDFHFNRKDTINSELDIYIPELKLAFELNGIFHYEPIYGPEKLNQIQNNDNRKFQACLEKGIELCVIDTSWIRNNTLPRMNKILGIVNNIISIKNQQKRLDSNQRCQLLDTES